MPRLPASPAHRASARQGSRARAPAAQQTGPSNDSRSKSEMLRKTITGLALAVLMASPAVAQTVDELVAKNIQARGGTDKIKAMKTARTTGKMVMGQGMEAPFVMMEKRPNLTRMEFTFQGMTGIQAYDGKNGWGLMPFMGKKEPEAVPDDQRQLMEEQADMDGPLVDYKTKGHKV